MKDLPWMIEARKYIGLAEVAGPKHNPTILGWLRDLEAWWAEDETPWCGTFVATVLRVSNRHIVKHWYRALAWREGGTLLSKPAHGCLVVFSRAGGGHVGFLEGVDSRGNLMVLGGNQGNRVSVAPFDPKRAVAFVWPSRADGTPSLPYPERYELPVLRSDGKLSTNEA